jgi:glutamine synthetase
MPVFPSLQQLISYANAIFGVEFLVGFETEFTLLRSTSPIEPVTFDDWCTSNAFPSGAVQTLVLEEISDALMQSEVEVLMYHAEAAPGQVR